MLKKPDKWNWAIIAGFHVQNCHSEELLGDQFTWLDNQYPINIFSQFPINMFNQNPDQYPLNILHLKKMIRILIIKSTCQINIQEAKNIDCNQYAMLRACFWNGHDAQSDWCDFKSSSCWVANQFSSTKVATWSLCRWTLLWKASFGLWHRLQLFSGAIESRTIWSNWFDPSRTPSISPAARSRLKGRISSVEAAMGP